MSHRAPPVALLASALLVACADSQAPDGAPTPDDAAYACVAAEVALDLSAVAPDGVVPAARLAAVPAAVEATFRYEDGAESTVAFSLDVEAARAVWVDESLENTVENSSGEPPDDAPACRDRVAFSVPFTFATADGAFDAAGILMLDAQEDASLRGAFAAPPAEFGGAFAWDLPVGADPASAEGSLSVVLAGDGVSSDGAVELRSSGVEGEVAWAERTPIGGWSSPE
jgi:hypothetical protein